MYRGEEIWTSRNKTNVILTDYLMKIRVCLFSTRINHFGSREIVKDTCLNFETVYLYI